MAMVAAFVVSPTLTEKVATIISSAVAAAWANCELWWTVSMTTGALRRRPNE